MNLEEKIRKYGIESPTDCRIIELEECPSAHQEVCVAQGYCALTAAFRALDHESGLKIIGTEIGPVWTESGGING